MIYPFISFNIKTDLIISKIEDIQISQTINNHSYITLKGTMSEEAENYKCFSSRRLPYNCIQ